MNETRPRRNRGAEPFWAKSFVYKKGRIPTPRHGSRPARGNSVCWRSGIRGCHLDEDELADWRAGRNAVYQRAALTIGARLAVADA
jgi:hypothetical protein